MRRRLTSARSRRSSFSGGGEAAVAGGSLVALRLEGCLPGAEQVLAEAEGAGGLGDGVALLGTSSTASTLNSLV
jgi:hypothetical protein